MTNALLPEYRVILNKNLLIYPLFIEYLKRVFRQTLAYYISLNNVKQETVYKFTITYIPVQGAASTLAKIKLNDRLPDDKKDSKLTRIAEILKELDPIDPHPVDVEFTLEQIINFVVTHVGHFQELTQGGIIDYFGIDTDLWFDDYPILTGTVLKAVDFGTLDNKALYLFCCAFNSIRVNLMNLFTMFVNSGKDQETLKVHTDVDI